MGPVSLSAPGALWAPASSTIGARAAGLSNGTSTPSTQGLPAATAAPVPAQATYARPAPAASGGAQQLEFGFSAETRYEESFAFTQRTRDAAAGMDGATRDTYLELSQQVAARFEMSVSISGESLGNFASLSEEGAGHKEFMKKLMEVAKVFLAQADAAFQEFFSALGGGTGWSFREAFQRLQEQWDPASLLNTLGGLLGEGSVPASGNSSAGAVQLEFRFSASFQMQASATVMTSDPVMLDLDGDGFELTSHTQGARFDILGKGSAQKVAFVTGGDAFLALDANGNGAIDSGLELFGDQRGAANGYEELRKLDSNGDDVIDSTDEAFGKLLLFKDNGNGITEAGELISLRDAGITGISLRYAQSNEAAPHGNRMAQLGAFKWANGNTGRAGDAVLNYTA